MTSKRKGDEVKDTVEKKATLHCPPVLLKPALKLVLTCDPKYKMPDPNLVNVEFHFCKNAVGPDYLVVYPHDKKLDNVAFCINRKTKDEPHHRIEFAPKERNISMTGRTEGNTFVITGPDFNMVVIPHEQPKPTPEVDVQVAQVLKEQCDGDLAMISDFTKQLSTVFISVKMIGFVNNVGNGWRAIYQCDGEHIELSPFVYPVVCIRANGSIEKASSERKVTVYTRYHGYFFGNTVEVINGIRDKQIC